MQFTKLNSNDKEYLISSKINIFFERFNITSILNESSIKKVRGVKVKDVILKITELPFKQQNFYQGIVNNKELGFNKSVAYDLLNNPKYNWRLFLYKVVSLILKVYFTPLKQETHHNVLILDDTSHPRNRSKKVELLARVYDHVTHRYFRGFRIMTMGWSDGNSFIPVDFALLSSNKISNRYQEMNRKTDKRSCGYKRRQEGVSKSTDLIAPMVKRILDKGIKAQYLLMDSWYGLPSVIKSVNHLIDVICRVKDTSKIYYYKDGEAVTLSRLYRSIRKNRGKACIKGSAIVEIRNGGSIIPVKIVFVRNRNEKKNWIGILSTDINLSDEEIVRIYGKRWQIEVFFKTVKQFLNINGEVELRSYDGMIAHISIVMLRYIFISVGQRDSVDSKTHGGIFQEMINEMKDITLFEAINIIFECIFKEISKIENINKEILDQMYDIFIGVVVKKFNLNLKSA